MTPEELEFLLAHFKAVHECITFVEELDTTGLKETTLDEELTRLGYAPDTITRLTHSLLAR